MTFFRSLQFRLLLLLIVGGSLPIGVIAITNLTSTSRLVQTNQQNAQIEATRIATSQVTAFIDNIVSDLRSVGQAGIILDVDMPTLNHILARYAAGQGGLYRSVWLIDAQGQEVGGILEGQPLSESALRSWAEDELFFRPQRGEVFFSNVRVVGGAPQVSVSVPFYVDDGTFAGAVAAIIDLQSAWAVITTLQLGETGYAVLLDRRGNVMVHRDADIVAERYNLANLPAYVAAQPDTPLAAYEYDSPIGGEVLGTAARIRGPEWVLVIERARDEAYATIQQIQSNLFIGVLIAIWLAALVSLWLSSQIASPITELLGMVQHFGAGDLTVRARINRQDEIGQLAAGFDDMAERLKRRIQEVNQKNDALQEANEKVTESVRLKDEFLAIMSHELRTPLNAIMGFAGILLMDDTLKEKQTFQVQRIEANSERLLNLINDILDISRMQAGRMAFNPVPLSVRDVMTRIYEQLGVLAKQKRLAFTYHVEDSVPAELVLDEDALIKILTNLCSNALKFTAKGGVDIHLNYKANTLTIAVTDTGIGIPPQAQEIIFDEFRQVDGSSARAYGGTGLGLSIVRRICLALGGTVTVRSKVDEGSTFTVSLPALAA